VFAAEVPKLDSFSSFSFSSSTTRTSVRHFWLPLLLNKRVRLARHVSLDGSYVYVAVATGVSPVRVSS
jgi:hypothetical protein